MLGKTGGLEMTINGWLPADAFFTLPFPDNYSQYEGTWVITTATGDLKGLVGQGTWGGVTFFDPDCAVNYPIGGYIASTPLKGNIHFEGD